MCWVSPDCESSSPSPNSSELRLKCPSLYGVTTSRTGIVTLTPSPALDRTYIVDSFERGHVNRASAVTEEFAGKGVNVSRNLALAGLEAPAVVPLSERDQLALRDDALIRPSTINGRLRVNITAIESDGTTTKLNQQAPALSRAEWDALVSETVAAVDETGASWVIVAGSFPEVEGGVPSPGGLSQALNGSARIALDTSGAVLIDWAKSGLIDFIKPNVRELGEAVGRELQTIGEVIDAANEVSAWGVKYVMVSMGEDGFLGVADSTAWWAQSEPVVVKNTIGAGDSSVSGFFASLMEQPDRIDRAVVTAATWGAQKVQQSTSQLLRLDNLPVVNLHRTIDLSRAVTAD